MKRNWRAWRWNACSRCPDAGLAALVSLHSCSPAMRHAAWLLLLVFAIPGAAAPISVHTERHGERFDVQAAAEIDADLSDAWTVLTDYDRLAQFIPGMLDSRVVSREGTSVIVEQRGEVRLLFLKFPMQIRLAVLEYPPHRVESQLISGNFKQMHGIYHVDKLKSGLRLRYEGSFTPDFAIPLLVGTLMVRNLVEARFRAMVLEIESTQRRAAPASR